jgi:hypothetical protein
MSVNGTLYNTIAIYHECYELQCKLDATEILYGAPLEARHVKIDSVRKHILELFGETCRLRFQMAGVIEPAKAKDLAIELVRGFSAHNALMVLYKAHLRKELRIRTDNAEIRLALHNLLSVHKEVRGSCIATGDKDADEHFGVADAVIDGYLKKLEEAVETGKQDVDSSSKGCDWLLRCVQYLNCQAVLAEQELGLMKERIARQD